MNDSQHKSIPKLIAATKKCYIETNEDPATFHALKSNGIESSISVVASPWPQLNPFVADVGSLSDDKSDKQEVYCYDISKLDVLRKSIFASLHRPNRFAFFYHLSLVIVVFCACFTLNLLPSKNGDRTHEDYIVLFHYKSLHITMLFLDGFLCVWFFAELLTRLWSANGMAQYRDLSGKYLYFEKYFLHRLLDIFGVFTFFGYLIFCLIITALSINIDDKEISKQDEVNSAKIKDLLAIDLIFRFAHLLQIMQVYRVTHRFIKPLYITVYQQRNPLFLAILALLALIFVGSMLVFMTEETYALVPGLKNEFESIWLTFEAFSTVGYGDLLLYSRISIFVLCIFTAVGVWVFALPSYIIGNGLSIALQDQRRITFKYLSIAKLIRTAITNQQITKRVKLQDSTQLRVKRRARLLTQHIKSVTRIKLLKQDAFRNFDYQRLREDSDDEDDDDDSMRADKELWNKLLLIGKSVGGRNVVNNTENEIPIDLETKSNRTRMEMNEELPSASGNIDCLKDMDLSKYSGFNSLLWYTLDLIESDIDEIGELLHDKITRKFQYTKRIITELYQTLEDDDDVTRMETSVTAALSTRTTNTSNNGN